MNTTHKLNEIFIEWFKTFYWINNKSMLEGGDKLVCKIKNIKEIEMIWFDLNKLHRISKNTKCPDTSFDNLRSIDTELWISYNQFQLVLIFIQNVTDIFKKLTR